MAWTGTYTQRILNTLNDLSDRQYQSDYKDRIDNTANMITNYGDYSGTYQPQLKDTVDKINNYGDYTSKYHPQIDSLAGQLTNWNYDPEKDVSYQAYKRQYTDLGNKAMKNTLGQVSARTGGMASSYAGTAAQQSYNDYMAQLSNIIPQLENNAYNRASNNLNLYQNLDSTDYGRWSDALNRLYAQNNMLQGLDNTDYNRWLTGLQDLYNQNNMYLGMDNNAYNQYQGDLNNTYSLLELLYAQDAIERQDYLTDLAQAQAAMGGYGGGYGGGRGGSSGSTGGTGTSASSENLFGNNTYSYTNGTTSKVGNNAMGVLMNEVAKNNSSSNISALRDALQSAGLSSTEAKSAVNTANYLVKKDKQIKDRM